MRAINVVAASGAMVVATCAVAQVWCPASGWPGVPAEVGAATAHDPDGAGPLAKTFVVALKQKASATDALLYQWNGAAWIGLDGGADRSSLPATITCLTSLADGRLVVNGVAALSGGTWSQVAPVVPLNLNAVQSAQHPDGRLIVLAADGQLWSLLGTTWSIIPPNGFGFGSGNLLVITPNGDIWTAGNICETYFDVPTDQFRSRTYAARWNGQAWNLALVSTGGGTCSTIRSLAAGPDGAVYVSGRLEGAGTSVKRVGGAGLGPSSTASLLTQVFVTESGDVFAGAVPTSASVASPLARWNGSAWVEVPGAVGTIGNTNPFVFAANGPALLVAGRFPSTFNGGNRFYRNTAIYTPDCENVCDTIDFNGNLVYPEDDDVITWLNVLAGAGCETCNDIDFNNDGVFPSEQDVIDFFNVLAGGPCS